MPSPIAHIAAGYAVYRLFGKKLPVPVEKGAVLFGLAACVTLSLVPDTDCVVGVLAGNFGRYHNNVSHSLLAGVATAMFAGGIMKVQWRIPFLPWFLFALACYWSHILLDYFTEGRGVMAFWPVLTERFHAPWLIFRGVQWAQGVWTIQHVWTAIEELCFAALVLLVVRIARKRGTGPRQ